MAGRIARTVGVLVCTVGTLAATQCFGSPGASAGVDHGKVEAHFSPGAAARGADVSLLVTATRDPRETGVWPTREFGVAYNSRSMRFVGHNDAGACRFEPMDASGDPSDALYADTYVACPESAGDRGGHRDTLYFEVSPTARLGSTGVFVNATYGSINASTLAYLDVGTPRPRCASSDYDFRGFCIPNDLSFLIDVTKRLQDYRHLTPDQQHQLYRDIRNARFWAQMGKLAAFTGGKVAVTGIMQLVQTFLANEGHAS